MGATTQTINVTTHAPASAAYNSVFSVAATASSGLPVTITSTGVCSLSGSNPADITMTSGTGTCSVYFNQGGDANYNAAIEVRQDTLAEKVGQTIIVVTPAPSSAAYNSVFPVAANATSGLPVTITSTGVCSLSGSNPADITMTSGTGTCSVYFNQGGDANYNAAIEVRQDTLAEKVGQTIIVVTPAPSSAAYNSVFPVAANATSGLPVTITSTGVCSLSGSNPADITMTSGTGTCYRLLITREVTQTTTRPRKSRRTRRRRFLPMPLP